MAKFSPAQAKPFILLGVFLGLWFVLPVFLKNFARDTLYEFQAPLWTASSVVRDLQTTLHLRTRPRSELVEALRDLSRENALHRLERGHRELDAEYIRRLEHLLNLPSRPEYQYEIARVVRRDLNAWWQRLTIRKGRDYDIPVGAAVVFAGGVVGRVVEVHAFTSEVELVSSPLFRMAAQFEGDLRPVTYNGARHTQFSIPQGRVSDVPPDLQPSPGRPLTLVSSELGGVFPAGLTIGTIHELAPGRDGLFQTGPVRLDERLLTLREVSILIPLTHTDAAGLDWFNPEAVPAEP